MTDRGSPAALLRPAANVTVPEAATFRQAVSVISDARSGIALVVDAGGQLRGTVTDGDVRRAILAGISLEAPVAGAMNAQPLSVTTSWSKGEIVRLFADRRISHLPVVDDAGKVVGLYFEADFRKESVLDVPVVLMAGGIGKRLRPLTNHVPKPLLLMGDRPLIDCIIDRFVEIGCCEFFITVNYMAEVFEQHFAARPQRHTRITLVRENEPLGTAGALRLLNPRPSSPFLLMNADVLTTMDFRDLQAFHTRSGADVTVAVKRYDMQVPYGAVTLINDRLVGLAEKPAVSVHVNAGIYMLNPGVIDLIPQTGPTQMTDLIASVLKDGRHVAAYVLQGDWIDIGNPADYARGVREFGGTGDATPGPTLRQARGG